MLQNTSIYCSMMARVFLLTVSLGICAQIQADLVSAEHVFNTEVGRKLRFLFWLLTLSAFQAHILPVFTPGKLASFGRP